MKKIFAIALLAAALTLSTPAHANDINTYKARGVIGEQADGMIGVVDPTHVSEDVFAFVSRTNAQRSKRYEEIAAKNGTEVDQVQALAGAKLIQETPSGQYIQNAAGRWQKK